MKTRVISTDIWDEDKVFNLNIDTKLVYLILLTNPYIGQSRYYRLSDRQISTFSGLNIDQIQKCKKDLEDVKMAYFKDGYICITGYGFVECFYKGEKNEIAKKNELEKIPSNIKDYFNKKIGYQYPIDTPLNLKSEIINHKSEIKNKELEIINTPDWLNVGAWNEWVEYRKEKRKPLSKRSIDLQLKELEANKSTHVQMIHQSIKNGWTGLFPLKDNGKKLYVSE